MAWALPKSPMQTSLPPYAVRVLLEAGLGMHIVWRSGEDERFHLGRLGHFLLEDEMTRVNFDFTRDVCYAAAAHLDEALVEGRPAGLRTLGPWATLYEGLSALPEPARRSWFAFDHFHSDAAFPDVCARLALQPACQPARHRLQHRPLGEHVPAALARNARSACATCRSSSTWPARTCARRAPSIASASTPPTCWTRRRLCRRAMS